MKKRDGSVLDILTVLFAVLAVLVIMIAYLGCVKVITVKEDVSQVARKYILRMETVGYLTAADQAYMEQELQKLGMTDISLLGTTLSNVGYGNPITLHITGQIPWSQMIGSDLFSFTFVPGGQVIEEKRVSTAKN